jgi:hypothetical protein
VTPPGAYEAHRVDDRFRVRVGHDDLDPYLGHEIDPVLGAPVHLGVAALAAVSAGLGDGQAVHAELLQSGLHLVEAVRSDDRGDELHEAEFLSFESGEGRTTACGAP